MAKKCKKLMATYLAQSAHSGIKLENRQGFRVPLETRLEQAQDVSLLGINLVGLLTHYEGFINARAKAGCKFRILITDPDVHSASGVPESWQKGLRRKQDTEHSVRTLRPMIENTQNIQLKYTPFLPPFSLLIIDPDKPHGEVQVELYVYEAAASDRPHFVLTQSTDKQWYDFFREQFELAWQDARPYDMQREI